MRLALLAVLLVTATLVGCTNADEPRVENPIEPCGSLVQSYDAAEEANPRILFETSKGNFTAAFYLNQVPFLAGGMLERAGNDFYNGTRFHKLFPGQLILGGDPSTRGPREAWGRGAQFSVPDRFHQFLRHDEPGTVSLWSPKPHSGGAQFTVTLRAQPTITEGPTMDDRHPVVGQVLEGMDTVRKISETPTDQQNRPEFDARIFETEVLPPLDNETDLEAELSAYGFDCHEVAAPGDEAEYLLAVRNTGQALLNGTFEADAPDGFDVEIRDEGLLPIPSGQTVAYPINVTVPEDAQLGSQHEVDLTWQGTDLDASITRTVTVEVGELGPAVTNVSKVKTHYVGTLGDARPFDTTVEAYATSSELTWFKRAPNATQALTLNTDTGAIEGTGAKLPDGMVDLLGRAHVGETVVAAISPSDAFGAKSYGENNLGGRLLYFQIIPIAEG